MGRTKLLLGMAVIALTALVSVSCFSPWTGDEGKGTVEVRISSPQGRAVMPYPPVDRVGEVAHKITLTLADTDNDLLPVDPLVQIIRDFPAGTTTGTITGIDPGFYTIEVLGTWNGKPYSLYPDLSGTGTPHVVEVVAGQTAQVDNLQMTEHGDWPVGGYYTIVNETDLRNIGSAAGNTPLDGEYLLMNDITFPAGTEWIPIGAGGGTIAPFTGTFDGQNNSIIGLAITNASYDTQGLFAAVGDGAGAGTVKNLKMESVSINASPMNQVGAIAGNNRGGIISGCEVSGSVQGAGNTGGVVGINAYNGTVTDCTSTADVTGTNEAGGVVGSNSGANIMNSSSSGTVTGSGNSTGGVAGFSNGTIFKCSSTGTVTGSGDSTGGVVGNNGGNVSYSYHSTAAGTVTGGDVDTGGVAGVNNGTIEYCYSLGNVSGGTYKTGGVAGANSGTIAYCFAEGTIEGDTYIGGVAGASGDNAAVIHDSYYAGGTVKAKGFGSNYIAGGVVGYGGDSSNTGRLINCYAAGTVELAGSGFIGGVQGHTVSGSSITNCVALNGNLIMPAGVTYFGRVAGSSDGTIAGSYGKADMQKDGALATWTSSATGKDGENIDTTALSAIWWNDLGYVSNPPTAPWVIANGAPPTLNLTPPVTP